jgi:hypothetical protein
MVICLFLYSSTHNGTHNFKILAFVGNLTLVHPADSPVILPTKLNYLGFRPCINVWTYVISDHCLQFLCCFLGIM